jgi:hypothetical protein
MKIDELVREMWPTRYTTTQAAKLVGKSDDTLRRWKYEGIYEPSEYRAFGALDVALYTNADIKAMRKLAREIKPGRKPGSPDPSPIRRLRHRPRPNRLPVTW